MLGMQIVTILTSRIAVIVYELILLVILIVGFFLLRKKNKGLREMVSLQKDRIREESLDSRLMNKAHMERASNQSITSNPYDVVYHEESTEVYKDTDDHISVQVQEKGILATKKYVVHVFDEIGIGRDDVNKIILNDVSLAPRQISLIRVEKLLFARNLDEHISIALIRGKHSYGLSSEAVQIENGDILKAGNTTLRLTII